jgi:hypothetical protein
MVVPLLTFVLSVEPVGVVVNAVLLFFTKENRIKSFAETAGIANDIDAAVVEPEDVVAPVT